MSEHPPEYHFHDPDRGTGRTTGLILQCFALANLSPGEWVEFVDHWDTLGTRSIWEAMLRSHAQKYGLTYEFKTVGPDKRVWIRKPSY